MLVEFRIKNFRSFKEEAVFSLVASAAHKEHQNTHVVPIPEGVPFKVPGILRTAAIYGANASGKSNLMRALQLLRGIVVDSAKLQPTQTLNLQPFALDEETKGQPIEMEVTFLRDGVRYQYGFTARPDRILSEWLLVYRSSKPQTWFSREFSATDQMDNYNFSASFQGQRDLWKKATRPNALFLSTAIQLNSEQLRPVYNWISDVVVFERGGAPSPLFTIEHILKTPENRVQALLHAADIGIAKIDIDKRTAQARGFQLDTLTGKMEALPPESGEINVPLFLHQAPKGSAVFGLEDESDGTQRLFHLAGPLFEIMQTGRTLCVDELDRSLHPLLVRQLVEMFYDPAINPGNAQLIFTTHDTTLLSAEILRRDQVWFAEKDQWQASRLFPLTDFSVRKGEAFERGYLSGRYGAIPILNPQEVVSRGK
jgi:AAA15 family ATPase/GTPase